ncbi:MAG: C39 family peptidase [Candidatus Magasanikbacteria bacterium]|nr:C39 family peptidase [Candidatus Magasanikbacteria bacterium]
MRYYRLSALGLLIFFPISSAFAQSPATINLPVPFIWEIPDGAWVKPWNGACEEASIMMVDQFYRGRKRENVGRIESKNLMRPLFSIEDKLFGGNADTNATRTLKIIDDYTNFDGELKFNPTVDDIAAELALGHPVISLHYGFDLNNPHHRFRRGGSSYHMLVLTGFDTTKKLFFANDSELKEGLDYPYQYATIISSLHDFNHTTHKADGPPVVIFTHPKQLVRETPGNRIYLVRDGKKYYISHPRVFQNHRWSWAMVKPMSPEELGALESGPVINN